MDYSNVRRDGNGWYDFTPQQKAEDNAAIAAHAAGQGPSTFFDRRDVGQELSSGNGHLLGSPGYNEFKGGVGSSPLADAMESPRNAILSQSEFAPTFSVQTQRGNAPVATEQYKSNPEGMAATRVGQTLTPEEYHNAAFTQMMSDPNIPVSEKVRMMQTQAQVLAQKEANQVERESKKDETGAKREQNTTENAVRVATLDPQQQAAFNKASGKPVDVTGIQPTALDAMFGDGFSKAAMNGGNTSDLDRAVLAIKHAAVSPDSPEYQRAIQLIQANHGQSIGHHLNDRNPSNYPYLFSSPAEPRAAIKEMFGQPAAGQAQEAGRTAGGLVNTARIGLRKGHATTNRGAGY